MSVYHVGVDLHKNFSQATVIDDEGKVLGKRRLWNDPDILEHYFSGLPKGSPVVMEATRNWYWMADFVEGMGLKLILAHPKKVRIIAEATVKTDKIDSEVLAHLERTNFLPMSYIPPKEIRDVRELLRYRMSLVKIRTSLKNRAHSVLAKMGVRHSFSDVFSGAGLKFLNELNLPEIYRYELGGYTTLIGGIKKSVADAEKKIRAYVKEESEDARLLMTIPGISYFSALLLAAEIGSIGRFRSYRKLCAYGGVVATTQQSADKVHQGHISKDANKYIKWCLIEAVDHAIRKDPKLAALYQKVLRKKGKQKARVAVARKLLISIYYMLKNRTEYKIRQLEKYYWGKTSARVSPVNILATKR